jgi:membrane fusion protein, protease secretion system
MIRHREKKRMKILQELKQMLGFGKQDLSIATDVQNDNKEYLAQADTDSPIRLGVLVLGVGFGLFLLWAAFAPLDEGVPSQGSVSIDTKRKVIQHLTGGIVKQVHVKEGQNVKAGELLITLDDSMAKARYEEVRQRYVGNRAMENRLQAEQSGLKTIQFSADLLGMRNDPVVKQQMQNQEYLLISRRSALNAEIQGMEESIQGQEAMIQGFQGILESKRNQLSLLNEQLKGVKELADEGFAPKNQQRDLELRIAQANGDIADVMSNMLRAKRSVAELRQRILQRNQEFRKEIETQMAQIKLEVDANADKFRALSEEYERSEIRSPVSGQVVGLQFQTIGAVIQPGQKVMDIVPLNEGLLVEVHIPPHLIDRIRTGQLADVRFSSFANSPQLAVDGIVESISKDLITDTTQNNPGQNTYYLARVSLTPEAMKKLGSRTLQPGMPVQVVIKTGERTLLTYLLHPLMKRMAASMKEE